MIAYISQDLNSLQRRQESLLGFICNPCSTEMKSSKIVKGKWITNYDLSRNNLTKEVYLPRGSLSHLSTAALNFEKRIYQSYGKIGCKDAAPFYLTPTFTYLVQKRKAFSTWKRDANEKNFHSKWRVHDYGPPKPLRTRLHYESIDLARNLCFDKTVYSIAYKVGKLSWGCYLTISLLQMVRQTYI